MNPKRFEEITSRYHRQRIAVVGDFCLDRYLEIDPTKRETSIETNLPVHNIVRVRSQPGGAGTILNNLAALGTGQIHAVGFAGQDGEGYELRRALAATAGIELAGFIRTSRRQTFTYTKPLLLQASQPPVELNRLDLKNWTETPGPLQQKIIAHVRKLPDKVDAIILLDQVDTPNTGVITPRLLEAIGAIARDHPDLVILADSRRSLQGYPPVCLKMNGAEFGVLTGQPAPLPPVQIPTLAARLAQEHGRPVFVTLAEHGILGAAPGQATEQVAALPLRGPIDIVGAGDAVTANLVASLAAGATLAEAIQLANAAASVVIHQLGTTGTATVAQIRSLLFPQDSFAR